MTGRREIIWSYLLLVSVILSCCFAKISDQRLCFDKDCSEIVSIGRTTVPYHSKDQDVLSFPPNVEVKVFSKHAGKRQDLWGVEILGKRGYAPSKFIRETKVLQSKLMHLVPTEEIHIQNPTIINSGEVKKPIVHNNDQSDSLIQNESHETTVENELNINAKEVINPRQVSPSYESTHNETILQQNIEDIEPATPSYSTQTLQESIKEEEPVQLEVVPNLLSSTFSAISEIWNGSDDDEEENEENDEIVSSEQSVKEEATEKTPEIGKTDETSSVTDKLNSETEEENEKSEIKDNVQKLETNKVPNLEVEVEKSKSEEELVVENGVKESFSSDNSVEDLDLYELEDNKNLSTEAEILQIVDNEELPLESEIQSTSNEKTDLELNIPESVHVEKSVIKSDEPQLENTESVLESESDNFDEKVFIDSELEKTESNKKTDLPNPPKTIDGSQIVVDSIKTIQNENPETTGKIKKNTNNFSEDAETKTVQSDEHSFIPTVSTENNSEDFFSNNDTLANDKLQRNDVPNSKEATTINGLLLEKDSYTNAPDAKVITNNSEIDADDTTVNFKNIEETMNSEVPFNIKHEGESSAQDTENVLLYQESFLPNNLENNTVPVSNETNTSNQQISSDVIVEGINLENNTLIFQKPSPETKTIDENNNIDSEKNNMTEPPYTHDDSATENAETKFPSIDSSQEHVVDVPPRSRFGEFLGNRNLLNAGNDFQHDDSSEIKVDKTVMDNISVDTVANGEENIQDKISQASESKTLEFSKKLVEEPLQTTTSVKDENFNESKQIEENVSFEETSQANYMEKVDIPLDTCSKDFGCPSDEQKRYQSDKNSITHARKMVDSSETLIYVCITAVSTLLFSLGYYFIETKRRDAHLIAKINGLERDLMMTKKECIMLDKNFKSTKTQLDSVEGESIDSKETVASLKAELSARESIITELQDKNAILEKDLESTSEAGLEVERMLREILASQSEDNPLVNSIEDLQVRLNNQQKANDSLKNALSLKTQENETLTGDLAVCLKKVDQLQNEVTKLTEELQAQKCSSIDLEQTLMDQVQSLELQISSMVEEKSYLRKQLKMKEQEVKELLNVVDSSNTKSIDLDKLYDVAHIKAEAAHLLEEKNELQVKLSEEEDAHKLLEDHVKIVREEVLSLTEQCKAAEKEKNEAETRLEVLTKFFEEKEAQRQKEEALWLEKQGEVSSTVEKIHTMQNEILNYKQQIEMLKREIVDQEREYKNQMSVLETKAHEQWLTARQNERRLEEVKAECSQLRNRLTLVEKNLNDGDSEGKLHRLQSANGEPGGPPHPHHPLFVGVGETSSSPLMFGSGGPPPPPPSYMFPPPPPFLAPPLPTPGSSSVLGSEMVTGSRPPPLGGGRLSSPPPPNSGSSNNPVGSPPPLSPPLPLMPPLPHFPHPLQMHRSPPPFDSHAHHHHNMPPFPLYSHSHRPPPGDSWGDHDALPPPLPPTTTTTTTTTARNSTGAFHPHQRDHARSRNHKGSLYSSGESLDKSHGGKN